jgi:hypothetical protein
MRLSRRTECIYASCSEIASVYTRLSRKKGRICFKTSPGKGKRLKTQTWSEQDLSSSDTTRNTKEKEKCKKKKYFNP